LDAEELRELEELEWIEDEGAFHDRWLGRRGLKGAKSGGGISGTDDATNGDDLVARNLTSNSTTYTDDGGSADDIFSVKTAASINEFCALASGPSS
jgi:hypothetical protein